MTVDAAPDGLARFLSAQDEGGTYQRALGEFRAGRKQSHWMWFVFPQIAGLGQSPTSRRFAISGLTEARAYLNHPVLGARLTECAAAVLTIENSSAQRVFGGIDAQKLRSSMTLFQRAAPQNPVFERVIEQYFDGVADDATDLLLQDQAGGPPQ